MKIFTAEQIREWDRYTILHEPISSIDLMERAARACIPFIVSHLRSPSRVVVLSGSGNNGGDGLAIARLLKEMGVDVVVFHPLTDALSEDNRINLMRWQKMGGEVLPLSSFTEQEIKEGQVIVDALLGTGASRPAEGVFRHVIEKVNDCLGTVIAIDIPSGMIADGPSDLSSIMRARYTLSFQQVKLAFLLPSTGPFCGEVAVIDIGLSRRYYEETESRYELTEGDDIKRMIRPRPGFSHKGDFGTVLMLAGKKGMMGAAILAAKACFRAGVGKLVCRIPGGALDIMQTALPEVICLPDENQDLLEHLPPLEGYTALAAGPGIGTDDATAGLVCQLLDGAKAPLVLDADALNLIALKGWQDKLREGMVITPHPGEFKRLFGEFDSDFDRIKACLDLSTVKKMCVILKGRYTFLSTASGKGYFNSTGNPGMAKAGSGDVLTGVLASFLGQKYSIDAASRLAAYIHGKAGDLGLEQFGEAGLMPSDTIDLIGRAIEAV